MDPSVAVSVMITALTPLNFTLEAPERFVPLMVTFLPASPWTGLNFVMVGLAAVTSKHSKVLASELAE